MAVQSPFRASVRRVLGRDRLEALEQRQQVADQRVRDHLDQTEARLAAVVAQVDGLQAAFDRLHATVVAADPEATRAVIEAVRADVTQLTVDLNRQLAHLADG